MFIRLHENLLTSCCICSFGISSERSFSYVQLFWHFPNLELTHEKTRWIPSLLLQQWTRSTLYIHISFSALLCPKLLDIPYSSGWECTNGGAAKFGAHSYGTRCTNTCNPGYVPRIGTTSNIICGLDEDRAKGKWSGKTLVCERELVIYIIPHQGVRI